jgi:hypothetical protein
MANDQEYSILDAFEYVKSDENITSKPAINDFVYVARNTYIDGNGYYGKIAYYSDVSRVIMPVPALLYYNDNYGVGGMQYKSILDLLMSGYSFIKISEKQYNDNVKK